MATQPKTTKPAPAGSQRRASDEADRLLRIDAVCDLCSLCRSTIEKMIREESFPKPIRLGRSLRWHSRTVREWMNRLEKLAS